MKPFETFCHTLLMIVGTAAHVMVVLVGYVDGAMRFMMDDVGLAGDAQTLLVIIILSLMLAAVYRLTKGAIRFCLSMLLFLVLVHTLSGITMGPAPDPGA